MPDTAVEVLCKKNPLNKDEIQKISEKWEKRTSKTGTRWPKEGTFDPDVCEEMEVLMKNQKLNKKGKNIIEKRERERIILAMFKKEGEHWREVNRVEKEMVSESKELESQPRKGQPPAYNTGLYPLISGTVDIKGEVKLDEEKSRACGTQGGKGPPIHMDCYKEIRNIIQEWDSDNDSDDGDSVNDCSGRESHLRKQKGKKERQRAQREKEGAYPTDREQREREGAYPREEGERSPLAQQLIEEIRLRRSQRERKAPKSYAGAYPILIKGNQAQYVPWGSQDLEGLVVRLPNMNDGASKWIRIFEEHTVGKLMAVGDLKALLARVLGISKMENVLANGGLINLLDNALDGTTFNTYRSATWSALRNEYPTRVDHKSLKGHTMGDAENPASYLQKQVERWRMETEKDPEEDPLISVIFRTSIIETLPSSVRNKLEDVVGLTSSKTHKEFSDHLVHAVDRYRQNEQRMQEQSKEVQRKLSQLQLEEITRKDKDKKKQALVVEPGTMAPVTQQAFFPQAPPQMSSPLAQQPQSQRSPAPPVVNVYTQNSGNPNRQRQFRGPQGQYKYAQQQGTP